MDEVGILMDAAIKRNKPNDSDKKGKQFKAPPKRQNLGEFADELGI